MIAELIMLIVVVILSIVLIAVSIAALTDDEIPYGLTGLFFSLIIMALSVVSMCDWLDAKKQGGYIRNVENVKEVQIDTVYTVTNENIDTTYVLTYKKD